MFGPDLAEMVLSIAIPTQGGGCESMEIFLWIEGGSR